MKAKDGKSKAISIFALLCSLAAALEVVASASCFGPGATHDSAAYMYAAQSFLNGKGFQYFGYPSPYIQWPPLYPLLLALGKAAGLSFGISSMAINSLAYALTVFFAARWMFARFGSRYIAAAGTLLLTMSSPLLQVSSYIWTEIMFVLFILISFIELERFRRSGKYGSLLASALFAALACLDRYAGVVIIMSVCFFLLFLKKGRKTGIPERIFDAAVYGAVSAIPLAAWVIRNYMVSGTLLGVRLPSTYPLGLNIRRTLYSIRAWVRPERLLHRFSGDFVLNVAELVAVAVPLSIIALFALFLAKNLVSHAAVSVPVSGDDRMFAISYFAVFSFIYIVYLIASATAVSFEPINSRYLVPVYLPAVLGVLSAADIMRSRLRSHAKDAGKGTAQVLTKATTFAIVVIAALYLLYPLANTAATVADNRLNGADGYTSQAWRQKRGFLEFMNDRQATYYSNCADAAYVISGTRVYSLPKKSGPEMYGLGQFQAAVARDKASILIWFDSGVPETLYSLDELSRLYGMEEIGSFGCGKVYRIIK